MYIFYSNIDKFPDLKEVDTLDSVADVATLLDTFINIRDIVSYRDITGVMVDDEGYYHFVLNGEGYFDLYEFINEKFIGDVRVSCVNAKFVFPERLSRGVKDLTLTEEVEGEESDTGDLDEDVPTGFLSDDDSGERVYSIIRKSDNTKITIPEKGMIIGRSNQKTDYAVKGNINIGRVHCNLYYENGVLKVHDFNSLNGTFINKSKIRNKDGILVAGDTLTLADEDFLVVED